MISEQVWNTLFGIRLNIFKKEPHNIFKELSFRACNNKDECDKIFDDNQEHFVQMKWDGKELKTYIDNKEVKSKTSNIMIRGFKLGLREFIKVGNIYTDSHLLTETKIKNDETIKEN